MSEQDDSKPAGGPDIGAIVEQIKGIDPKQFSKALHEHAHDHYNTIFRVGYGTSKGEFEPKLNATQSELEKMQQEIQAREARIQELSEKAPDLSKVQAKYETALEAKAREMQELEATMKRQLEEAMGMVRRKDEDRFWSEFKRTLVSKHGIDEDYADVISQKQDVRKRVKWLEDGGQKVYQDDGTTPYPLTEGQQAYEVLAKDLVKSVPTKFINDRKPTTSGYSGRIDGQGRRVFSNDEIANMSDDQLGSYLKERGWSGFR